MDQVSYVKWLVNTLDKIKPFNELEIMETFITNDVRIGREDKKWLNAIIKKK